MNFAYPQAEHLKTSREFREVLKLGRTSRHAGFSISYLQNHVGVSRLGLTIGKKNGNAPQRNRMKRLWKEAFRLQRPTFPCIIDVVIRQKGRDQSLDLNTCLKALKNLDFQ